MRIKFSSVFLFWLILINYQSLKAQTFITPEILEKYSASVYSRVYEYSLATLIKYDKQILLANFLTQKDKLIIDAVTNNRGLAYSQKLIDSLEMEQENILDYTEKFRFYYSKYKKVFEAASSINVAKIKGKYNIEPAEESTFYGLHIAKDQRVLKAMITNSNFKILPDSNLIFFHKYDSIVNKYMAVAEGETFFQSKIVELNNLKKITPSTVNDLKKNYKILCLKRGVSFHQNFNAAMQFVVNDSIYYKFLYTDSINEVAKKQCKIDLDHYVFKYNLDDASRNKIEPILLEKAKRNAWLDTRYLFNGKRDSLQSEINELSWAKIKKELIKAGNTQLSKSKFITAIVYKNVLKITSTQVDSLLEANLRLDILTYNYSTQTKGAVFDNSFFSNETLRTILNEGQYDSLLQIIVRPQANSFAKQNWEALQKYNLTKDLDSVYVLQPIILYHSARLILWERYQYDTKTYNKLTAENYQNKPAILKLLDAAIKKDGIEE